MKKLKALMDLLPYYFRSHDTYKDNDSKGLLEKYLEIFGNYFEDIVVTDIKSLGDVLDINTTSDIYLGYLWEFLGQLPYANPDAVDPKKWKAYFNGFDSDTTISLLSKYWLYKKDTLDGDLVISNDTVRNLLKYSVTLFKIRGTEKFFETLMALYGLDIEILESQSSPVIIGVHGDEADYGGNNDDYGGNNDDYGGIVEYYKKSNIPTKFDSNLSELNSGTMDYTSVCNTCASIHFKLHIPSSVYNKPYISQYKNKIEKVIKRFLPINVRPIFEWVTPSGSRYSITSVILRPFVLVDNIPESNTIKFYNSLDVGVSNVFTTDSRWPGWYIYNPDTIENLRYRANGTGSYTEVHTKLGELNWLIGTKIRVMVVVLPVNYLGTPIDFEEDLELNPILFTVNGGSTEYESGHIFNITVGPSNTPITIEPKPVLLDDNWKAWYDYHYDLAFNSRIKIVSYKFGVDYNSEVVLDFNYGSTGTLPIISYKEIRSMVNGQTSSQDVVTYPVDIIWNDDLNNPITPELYNVSRYKAILHPSTSGEQVFYMSENPARSFSVTTHINTLNTYTIASPSVIQLTDDNPTSKSRLDVKLSVMGDVKLPNTLNYGYTVDSRYTSWFNQNVTVTENRGYSNAYYSGTFVVNNLSNISPVTRLKLFIPVLASPIRNTSQDLVFKFVGYYRNTSTQSTRPVTLFINVNLLTKSVTFTQKYTDTYVESYGPDSVYGVIDRLIREDFNRSPVVVKDEEDSNLPTGYKLVSVDFFIGYLIKGYGNSDDNTTGVNVTLTPISFSWQVETLSYSDLIIRSTINKSLTYNVGELAVFNHPGIYTFKTSYYNDPTFSLVKATKATLDVESLMKSDIKYTLEILDPDISDNTGNTIRLPYRFYTESSGPIQQATINLKVNLFTNLNQVDGLDTETQFPGKFDWTIEVFWGSIPLDYRRVITPGSESMQTLLFSKDLSDGSDGVDPDSYNTIVDPYDSLKVYPAEHFGKTGILTFTFNKTEGDRDYNPSGEEGYENFPPGLYTIAMHSKSPMEGQDYYQVIELYEDRDPNERQIHIDVDVISRAWLNPLGINGNLSTDSTKLRTWGYYKSHLETMVTQASYDVHVEVPEFRLLLSNNNIGYKKVWLYKSLPSDTFERDSDMIDNNINYRDLIYRDGPVESSTPTKSPGEGRIWVFTGTVYDIGELVKGPEEPGMYMMVVHQTSADRVTIGKAYIDVKEIANYRLVINPTASVLEGEDTAVSTQINVEHDSIWPKKLRLYSAFTNQWVNLSGNSDDSQTVFPVTFLAYTAGIYDFTVYWYNEDGGNSLSPIDSSPTHWEPLNSTLGILNGTFNVVRNTTLSPESRVWTWDGSNVILTVDLLMVNSDSNIPWTATISEDQ